MDSILLLVTILSLAITIAMTVLAVRLLRDERRRSDARVAALAQMAGEVEPELGGGSSAAAPDLDLNPETVAGVAHLFSQQERSSPWSQRLAIIGVLLVVACGASLAIASWPRTTGARQSGSPTSTTVEPAALELVSLNHTQQADSLTISGLVHNPRGAAPLSHIAVTAFLFGTDGTLLASRRAPLDFTVVGPGEDSPFVVTVPFNGIVARYRIGFRDESGRVVSHVDRRDGALVRNE